MTDSAGKRYSLFYGIAGLFLLLFIFLTYQYHWHEAGWMLALVFVCLAIAFRGNSQLRGLSFTVIIFAAVALAMYYPWYFRQWGKFKLSSLIIPLIQVIMFGMGTSMSLKDFAGVIKTPKGVMIGIFSQFMIMPVLGFILAKVSGFPPEIAAGIVLIGCSPSGIASNVMSFLARANLALSITITTCTTLLAPLITPVLMKILAGAMVEIDMLKMMWDIFKMIILPIGAGLIFNRIFRGRSQWLHNAMPLVSMAGIAFILTIITAAGSDNLLKLGHLLILFVVIHNLAGYFLGYWFARLLKMTEADCRTVALEVGMQNAGLASGIAKEMGKVATVGLAAAIFGPIMNITGSVLASWWHNRSPKNGLGDNSN
jgi:BASS family bile acid:Na+ symporter